jgi:8-oxo-dGTP pyrophosphatase MutT (NUDIX family)
MRIPCYSIENLNFNNMKQMYKVFLNDRLIKIGAPENITITKPCVKFFDSSAAGDVKGWFNSFKDSDLNEIYLSHQLPEKFFKLFQSAFLVIHAAGGVVLSGNRLLFIFRNGKWDLPKGKAETGEIPAEAAIREVKEETGIQVQNIKKQLHSTFHIYKSEYPETRGQWIFKETFWFEMICEEIGVVVPQREEGITQVRWIRRNNLDEVLANTYVNLKQVILPYRA